MTLKIDFVTSSLRYSISVRMAINTNKSKPGIL